MLARSYERRDTALPAKIVVRGREIDCTVRDVSAGGARLRLSNPNDIPHEFQLVFLSTSETRRVTVRWRRAKDIGVIFLQERRAFGLRTDRPKSSREAAP